jgi:hypothetical protein
MRHVFTSVPAYLRVSGYAMLLLHLPEQPALAYGAVLLAEFLHLISTRTKR